MPKKYSTELTEDEKLAFREAMRGITPLKHTKMEATKKNCKIKIRPLSLLEKNNAGFEFSDHEILPPVSVDAAIEFARTGVQHKMLRKLRLGQYNVDAILDLHGKTVEQARLALSQFLVTCQDKHRHVLIIHGKGRNNDHPVLKNKLNHWLRQTTQVIAFCSAAAKGGSGALYVLLRR